jgi:predicted TIM-barrel fold metal-dependent hydrolase
MWSSDYPHTDSPWPRSKEFIAKWIDTIDESEKYRVIGDNAAELYHVS